MIGNLILKIGLIALVQSIMTLLLYRARVANHPPLLDSDLLVFGVPAFAAACAHLIAFFSVHFLEDQLILRRIVIIALTIAATGLSFGATLLTIFNGYGS